MGCWNKTVNDQEEIIDRAINENEQLKKEKDFWHREAIRQAAEFGEVKIKIAIAVDKLEVMKDRRRYKVNRNEIKERVIRKFQIGKPIKMRIGKNSSITAKVISLNTNTVLTEHDGYKESFTYWDFLRMTTPSEIKQAEIYIPEKLGRRHRVETYC